ncbi:FMN-dependent NADH-azoreductase [Pasteurella sp. PK-2025]|uniref:FMN-dependent NADH-azoreductase n=1 Tax=unclassified Pasteurella TaxID=2621516 RepID=UPI003C715DA1
MKNVLLLKSSISGSASQSNQLSDYFIANFPYEHLIERDLTKEGMPHFDSIAANALRGEAKSAEEQAILSHSNTLIEELKKSDIVVINAPVYNFMIPTQLKSYFDYIARPRVTFQYTEAGPEGLIKGKKAVVILTSGGFHQGTERDLVSAYLKIMLGFIGITDVTFIYAEGLGTGAEAVIKAQNKAKAEIDQFIAFAHT